MDSFIGVMICIVLIISGVFSLGRMTSTTRPADVAVAVELCVNNDGWSAIQRERGHVRCRSGAIFKGVKFP